MEKQTTSAVAWIALIIAILALALAWTAFNRTGENLETMIANQVEEAAEEIEREYQAAEEATREGAANTLEVGADAMVETSDALDAGAENTDEAADDVRN